MLDHFLAVLLDDCDKAWAVDDHLMAIRDAEVEPGVSEAGILALSAGAIAAVSHRIGSRNPSNRS